MVLKGKRVKRGAGVGYHVFWKSVEKRKTVCYYTVATHLNIIAIIGAFFIW